MNTQIAEKKTKDRFSIDRIEKVMKFMIVCQNTFSQTNFKPHLVIKDYCKENHISSQYLSCMIAMGWVESKGDTKGKVYRWKAGERTIQPIDARRIITCMNEVVDKYRVVITSHDTVEETSQTVQESVTFEKKSPSILEQSFVTKKLEEETKVESSEKKVEVTEITYFWGLFKKIIKKEIQ